MKFICNVNYHFERSIINKLYLFRSKQFLFKKNVIKNIYVCYYKLHYKVTLRSIFTQKLDFDNCSTPLINFAAIS